VRSSSVSPWKEDLFQESRECQHLFVYLLSHAKSIPFYPKLCYTSSKPVIRAQNWTHLYRMQKRCISLDGGHHISHHSFTLSQVSQVSLSVVAVQRITVTTQVLIDIINAIYRASVGARFTVCPLGIAPVVPQIGGWQIC